MSDIPKDTKKDVLNKQSSTGNTLSKFHNVLLNDYHGFLVKKVEKLTSAVYVITGFLPADEPVRNRLRVCSLDLIEKASHPALLSEEGLSGFIARTSEIGSLLETARTAGLISSMNAELLSEEYANLSEFVKNNREKIREPNERTTKDEALNVQGLTESYKGHKSDTKETKSLSERVIVKKKPQKGQKDRRAMLLDLMSKKDKITIKDAVSLIKDCSEKTLQRELLSLVEEGVALKEGERRWSTYRMATAFPSPVQI